MGTEKIIQVTTANPGWYTVYKDNDGTEFWSPLACWVLVEVTDDGETWTHVDGIDLLGEGADGLVTCSELGNFIRFDHEVNRQ